MSSLNQKILHGFAWEATTKFVVQIASWASTIWVARLLTPIDYGLVGISGIFTGLCVMLAGLGLGRALVNRREITEQQKSNIFWVSIAIALAFYLVIYFFAPFAAQYYESPELVGIIRFSGTMILISPLGIVPRAILARQMQFKKIALLAFWANLLVIALTLSMAFAGCGYWSLVVPTISSEILIIIIAFYYVRFIPRAPRNLTDTVPLIRYGLNIIGAGLVSFLNGSWPVLIAGQLYGTKATGYYQFSNTVARLPMNKIASIFASVAFPVFSRMQDNKKQLKNTFLQMHKYLFIVIAPMFAGMALCAPQFVPILLGNQWLPIIVPVQILCVANILGGSTFLMPVLLDGLGRADVSFKYELLMMFIFPAALLTGTQWGLNGMLLALAMATPIGYVFLVSNVLAALELSANEFIKSLSGPITCSIVMVFAVLTIENYSSTDSIAIILASKILVGLAAYSLLYCLFWPQDISRIWRLIRGRGKVVEA
jgi:O-antigen/teichoic acid export membrane protein